MNVKRVHTEDGSHIEPPLDQEWPNLKKLRWRLAVMLHDAGLPPDALVIDESPIRTAEGSYEGFNLHRPGWSASTGGFHNTWTLINGIGDGIELARVTTTTSAAPRSHTAQRGRNRE